MQFSDNFSMTSHKSALICVDEQHTMQHV